MFRLVFLSTSLALISGCAVIDRLKLRDRDIPAAPESVVAPPQNPVVLGEGTSAATLDTTTAAEKEEALAASAPAAERTLGTVAVSLGSPAEQGFWLRAALVTTPGKGRVVTQSGQSIAVDLIPGESGAQLSLAAFRALGLSLTDLPEVTVYAQ